MYKKILLPIDGSEISTTAAKAGIDLAKQVGASVVLVNVLPPLSSLVGFDGMAAAFTINNEGYEQSAKQEAELYMEPVLTYAKAQEVTAHRMVEMNYSVADAVVNVASEEQCDLIHIASHGRSGLSRLILGSVTAKVLSLAQTSVLVYRV